VLCADRVLDGAAAQRGTRRHDRLRPVPEQPAARRSPAAGAPGRVVFDDQYYTFSSVFFYADVQNAKLLNGRVNNLEYGSYAPERPTCG